MVSIILPSYKGALQLEQQLPVFRNWLDAKSYQYEILVVDDGSQDDGMTRKVVENNGCVYLENPVNMGKGAAVRRGMLKAKGDFILFTDADIPFDFDSIERFIFYLKEKEFDVVIGDRTLEDSSYFTEITSSRKFGSNVFTFIVGRFITTGLFDTQCGLKGFRGSVAKDLFSVSRINGFAFDVEILYISLKRNYDIKRLPVRLRVPQTESTVSLLKHSFGMVVDLLKIKLNHFTGKYNKVTLSKQK
jgi:dolichyl-phosphate beta-glucosyltransferase